LAAPVVVAPTDIRYNEEDVRTLVGKSCSLTTTPKTCTLTLDKPLTYNHYGNPLGVPDGFGGYIDETAEVALLSRNIVVTGSDEAAPYGLEGGHFMVFMTNTPQYIEGCSSCSWGSRATWGATPSTSTSAGTRRDAAWCGRTSS